MRARIVDEPNQLVTSLGCASHFDRNLLASIINLRVPPSSSVNLRSCLLASSRRVSSRPVSPRFASVRHDSCLLLTKRNGGIYKRSCQAWNSICLKIYPVRRTTPASNNPRDDPQTRETPRALFFVDMLDGPLALTTIDGPQDVPRERHPVSTHRGRRNYIAFHDDDIHK